MFLKLGLRPYVAARLSEGHSNRAAALLGITGNIFGSHAVLSYVKATPVGGRQRIGVLPEPGISLLKAIKTTRQLLGKSGAMIRRHLPLGADFFERPPTPDVPLAARLILTDLCAGRILDHRKPISDMRV